MKLKKFNDFEFLKESKSCPDCIKKFIVDEKDLIIDSIKNRTDLLNLSIFIDSENIDVCIIFNHDSNNYSSNINFDKCVDSDFKDCKINLNVPNILDINKLLKSLTHELTHLYELYKIKDIFDKSRWHRSKSLKKVDELYSDEILILYFRDLFYNSLKHEINAKISSLCIYLDSLNTKNKNALLNELYQTTEWYNYNSLYDFNPKKYLSDLLLTYDLEVILTIFNYFNKLMGIKTKMNSEEDILNYFNNTKRYFRSVCKKFKHKVFRYINFITSDDDILNVNEDKRIEINWREINLDMLFPDYLEFYN